MYLPQFHPIPENDSAWGKGFTEWTNVSLAKPLFRGHYQPHVPADLGFYDLRMPEVRQAQADMARDVGIEGFMYWHYWFGKGRMLLERPFKEVLESGKPNFPFCLGWANHNWTIKEWKKGNAFQKDPMIMEQLYPGKDDYIAHFNYCLPAFKDKRYITVEGKPVFTIFAPFDMPDAKEFIKSWRQLATENGLPGIHFVGLRYNYHTMEELLNLGFDAINDRPFGEAEARYNHSRLIARARMALRRWGIMLEKYDYKRLMRLSVMQDDYKDNCYPTILSGFDRTARSGRQACMYVNYTPEAFREHVKRELDLVKNKELEHKIIYLMSWNEWGEGNHMEPDIKYGHAFLDILKEEIK